ncbi:DNA methyltransferase [Paraburkholderia sp. MPAMCS5]|uniref:DNA methyltransferase n=1 Tax=Paraburkholderia sp. MPAMCS5 TaxID=3112563 RepID=UPI002E196A21|nr:DNA methyltransferase [Paraburkholderia sp. MPAMCS5]
MKEQYGTEVDGWLNKIFWGDNLQVMSHLLKKYRGKVELVYIDPPFDSKADYKKNVKLRGKEATNDQSSFEEKQYSDIWNNDEYLQFMYERLVIIRELMSDDASIYLHVGPNISHYVKVIMDEVFGEENYVNEIIWRRSFGHSDSGKCGIIHDAILLYGKTKSRIWNKVFHAPDNEYLETFFDCYDEERKERYQRLSLSAGGLSGGGYVYEFKGVRANWRCPRE